MLIVNDDDTCKVCGAYFQDNDYCANGHIRPEADIVRTHFKKTDSYKGPLGGNYSTWTNKQIVVGIHDDDDEIASVFDLTKQSFVYLDQKTKNGANTVKKGVSHKCKVCGMPATCHIYEENGITHLCLDHYGVKGQK